MQQTARSRRRVSPWPLAWALAVGLVIASCARAPIVPDEPPLPPGRMVEVQPGQTVWELAADNGLTVEEIVEVNGLRSADEVAAGQRLFLPAAGEPPTRPSKLSPSQAPAQASATAPALGSGTTETVVGDAPLAWPVDGVVLRDFAGAGRRAFEGLAIAAPAGTPVGAAAAGRVAFVGDQGGRTGLLVVVEHPDDLITLYAHLSSTSVTTGQAVARGDVLGAVGNTGLLGMSPQLEFQVRRGKKPIDPLPLLPP